MNYRKDEYIRAFNPFPRQPDVAMNLGVCALSREPRVVNVIQVEPLTRRVKLVGKGKKRVRRITY